jgi:hypothetical protein
MNHNPRRMIRAASLMFAALLALGATGHAQNANLKTVQGKVLASGEKPLSSAVVYLQNSGTKDIKTFISTGDGSYRFGEISGDADYTLWAVWKSRKSNTKDISSFDSRKSFTIDLHIKTE